MLQPRFGDGHDEGFTPVCFRDVEPELRDRLAKRFRRLEICPQASEVPRVLEGSERGDACGHQQHPRLQRIPLAAGAVHQEKKCKGRQQQHHAQVVAEPEREHRVEHSQPAHSGPIGPCGECQPGSADDQQVERVDLCRDSLSPEGVGKPEKQPRSKPADERFRQSGGQPRGQSHGKCAVDRGRQVERSSRLAGMEPHKEVSEAVIQRVGLPGYQRERPNPGLK